MSGVLEHITPTANSNDFKLCRDFGEVVPPVEYIHRRFVRLPVRPRGSHHRDAYRRRAASADFVAPAITDQKTRRKSRRVPQC